MWNQLREIIEVPALRRSSARMLRGKRCDGPLRPDPIAFLPLLPGFVLLVCVIGLMSGNSYLVQLSAMEFLWLVVPLGAVQVGWIMHDFRRYWGRPFCDDLPFRIVSHVLCCWLFGVVGWMTWLLVALGDEAGLQP